VVYRNKETEPSTTIVASSQPLKGRSKAIAHSPTCRYFNNRVIAVHLPSFFPRPSPPLSHHKMSCCIMMLFPDPNVTISLVCHYFFARFPTMHAPRCPLLSPHPGCIFIQSPKQQPSPSTSTSSPYSSTKTPTSPTH
jgi:hypothetical protein